MIPEKKPIATLLKYSEIKTKLILTQTVQDQIKYLCDKMSTVEWSGVLYHTSEGDIDDPKNFICTAQYILLLDKGSAAYTNYDFASDLFTNAIFDKPELLEMQSAQIHSHNSMSTFFSGTDNDELTDNASNYNYYLSLIVNNKGETCARIAFVGEIGGRQIKFKNKNGEDKVITTSLTEHTFYHEVDVVRENCSNIDEFFVKQYNAVVASKIIIPSYNQHDYYDNKTNNYGLDNYGIKTNNYKLDNYQQQLNFESKGKWDAEALMFIKYLLHDSPKEHNKPLTVILKAFTITTIKGKQFCKDHVAERVAKASSIFEGFIFSCNDYSDTTDLEGLWDRMVIVLSYPDYAKFEISKVIIDELKQYTWTTQ